MFLRDPRLNPQLRPHDWAAAARLNRLRALARASVVLAVLVGVAAYLWYPVDRTRDMAPEKVVEAAGLAILRAGHYRFHVDLSGQSTEYSFPDTRLNGQFQRQPQVLHLQGDVAAADSRVPLEYYQEGADVYLLHPTTRTWLVSRNTQLDELTAFLPDNLAAPFIGGLLRADEIGRERLPGGQAVRYRLTLDPAVMLPRFPELQDDRAEYYLWVYTRTLEPAKFAVTVSRTYTGENQQKTRFTYELTYQFGRQPVLAVPDDIKGSAQDVAPAPIPTPTTPNPEGEPVPAEEKPAN